MLDLPRDYIGNYKSYDPLVIKKIAMEFSDIPRPIDVINIFFDLIKSFNSGGQQPFRDYILNKFVDNFALDINENENMGDLLLALNFGIEERLIIPYKQGLEHLFVQLSVDNCKLFAKIKSSWKFTQKTINHLSNYFYYLEYELVPYLINAHIKDILGINQYDWVWNNWLPYWLYVVKRWILCKLKWLFERWWRS